MRIYRISTKKMLSCKNKPENSYTEKKVKHKLSGYAWCSICSFDDTKKDAIFIGEKIKNKIKTRKKSEIIVITPENLEELLIVFAI